MKVLIDVPDKKAEFIKDLKNYVDQVNAFKKRKTKLKNARDFLKTV